MTKVRSNSPFSIGGTFATNGNVIPPFAMIQHIDLEAYLGLNKIIFDLDKDDRIKVKDGLANFYSGVKQCTTLEELKDQFAGNIDGHYLVEFYRDNQIDDKAYDVKTKLRSLFFSIYIQKVLYFEHLAHGENFIIAATNEVSNLLGATNFNDYQDDEKSSLVNFYIVLREAKKFQTHKKWEKFAFYTISMAVGEGVWYCPGGGAKPATARRSNLYRVFEGHDISSDDSAAVPLESPQAAKLPMRVTPTSTKTKTKFVPGKPVAVKAERTPKAVAQKIPDTPAKKGRGRPRKMIATPGYSDDDSTNSLCAKKAPRVKKVHRKRDVMVKESDSVNAHQELLPPLIEVTDEEDMTQDEISCCPPALQNAFHPLIDNITEEGLVGGEVAFDDFFLDLPNCMSPYTPYTPNPVVYYN